MDSVLSTIEVAAERSWEELALSRISTTGDPYAVLVACVVSLRTRDEVTGPASDRLLDLAPDPARLAAADEAAVAKAIYPASFYRNKGRSLVALGKALVGDFGGVVPDDVDVLTTLPGVGRKTANLVVTLGYGKPGICVDTHVHRICNRLGFVRTRHADETEEVLRKVLPKRWWIPINEVLVAWGRSICTPLSPRCSECRVAGECMRVGVTRSR